MSTETNKVAARRFFEEGINGNRPELGDELFDPEFTDHNPLPSQPLGRAAGRYIVEFLKRTYVTPNIRIEDIFADGDRVALRWSAGPKDSPAVEALVILRFRNGKVLERWAAFNRHDV